LRPAKLPKAIDCSKCRFKCDSNFSIPERILICTFFWNLQTFKRQKDFLIKTVETEVPKRPRKNITKPGVAARKYYFTIGNKNIRVSGQLKKKNGLSNGPLRMNWSNIEKWRNLLKIGTIVLSAILKYCAKFKKFGRGILKLLPFKVSGYFTRVLMRNGAMVA
jgi:hypothetical protein